MFTKKGFLLTEIINFIFKPYMEINTHLCLSKEEDKCPCIYVYYETRVIS